MEEDTVRSVADATAEVAKASGKAIDLASGAGSFFDRVMGDLVEDGVGLIRDRLKFYRYERSLLLAQETQARLRKRGIQVPRTVPPKVAIPLIEAATIEDEPDLQSLWAELLTSAMDPSKARVDLRLVNILRELTSEDAKVLAEIHGEWQGVTPQNETHRFSGITYSTGVGGLHAENAIEVISLYRLGLIAPAQMTFQVPSAAEGGFGGPVKLYGENVTVPGSLEVVTVTALGTAFCLAVGL